MTKRGKSHILNGDCREVLAGLPEQSVHMCVCSPPYWGLRDYGVDGQLGSEPTLDEYIAGQVEVFRAVWRVLRDDGVMFVNMGDGYCNAGSRNQGTGLDGKRRGGVADTDGTWAESKRKYGDIRHALRGDGIKHKDLIGQPWRLAFALQADGWYLRSCLPWVKRSAMPDSAGDRPGTALEFVFMLTKHPRYFFDMDAVRVKARPATVERDKYSRILQDDGPQSVRHDHETKVPENGRQWRNSDLFFESLTPPFGMIFAGDEPVGLDVTSSGSSRLHFAAYPEALCVPLIKSSTSEKGCCPECGAPWRRVVEKETEATRPNLTSKFGPDATVIGGASTSRRERCMSSTATIGWQPGCECVMLGRTTPKRTMVVPLAPVPCTVLDCYAGSGTTGVVAKQLGRSFIGIELNPEYCEMARKRIENPYPKPEAVDVPGQETLFEAGL